jgi:integrase
LEEADNVFLKSHARALAAHEKLKKDLKSAEVVEDQTRRILRANGIEAPLSDMVQRFRDRRKNRSQNYVNQTCGYLSRFVDWMNTHHPEVDSLLFVRTKHIEDFLETERERDGKRVSAKTWNGIRGTLKTAFTEQARGSTGHKAFDDIPTEETDTESRRALTPEEIKRILDAAKKSDHDMIRGPLLTCIYTGMRRGDCFLLRWEDIDLGRAVIVKRTAKTKRQAVIPIRPALADLIHATPKGGEYVWTEAAALYQKDPDLTRAPFNRVLRDAGFTTGRKTGNVRKQREGDGLRAASKVGWHALRTSLVTSLLSAGVPAERVRRITGHTNTATIEAHYDQPDTEALRDVFGVLDTPKRDAKILERLEGMTAKNWKEERDAIMKLMCSEK